MAGILLRAKGGAAVALENVDVTNMFVGTIVVDDAAQAWQLTVSTAALDSTHKAVSGVTGLRWITYSGGGGGGTGDAWYDAQVAAMQTLVPALTRFEYIKVGQRPTSESPSVNAGLGQVVGGAVGSAPADNTTWLPFTTPVFASAKTDHWAVAFRVKYPAIATSKSAYVGLVLSSDAQTAIMVFGWSQSLSATKFYAGIGTANVTTVNADTNWHTVLLTGDATTITATLDGVTVATNTDLSGVNTNPASIGTFSSLTLAPGALVSRIAYGYIDPT